MIVPQRWLISGIVEATSALALKTGAAQMVSASGEIEEHWHQEIDRDHRSQPFLPATAFKGLIRALISSRSDGGAKNIVDALFGYASRDDDASDRKVGAAGRAEFRNAYATEGSGPLATRGMARIDPGTGAAADGLLRTQVVAETGATFAVEIVVDGLDERHVAFLVKALRLLDGAEHSALGGGRSAGFGRIVWTREAEVVRHLDAAAIVAWLNGPPCHWRDTEPLCGEPLTKFHDAVARTPLGDRPRHRVVLPLTLTFDGFFLVSRQAEKNDNTPVGEPDRKPLTRRGDGTLVRPLLPGSGAKGPLRAQAERIWRTVTEDRSDEVASAVGELFGTALRSGALKFSDFIGETMPTRRHELVAIDRFTGGAADGQKFTNEVFEAPTLRGEITIELKCVFDADLTGKILPARPARNLSREALGLLALLLRDLAEGDVAFGYGTRKGYGRIAAADVDGRSPVTALAAALGTDAASAERELSEAVGAFREQARAFAKQVTTL